LSRGNSDLRIELELFYKESVTGERCNMVNLLYKRPGEFKELTEEERENLRIVMEELKAWDTHDIDRLMSVAHEDIIYHDVTLPPAKGHAGLLKFAEGWLKASPDFSVFIEKFIVKGNYVVNVWNNYR
jgi:hypothetical protein